MSQLPLPDLSKRARAYMRSIDAIPDAEAKTDQIRMLQEAGALKPADTKALLQHYRLGRWAHRCEAAEKTLLTDAYERGDIDGAELAHELSKRGLRHA